MLFIYQYTQNKMFLITCCISRDLVSLHCSCTGRQVSDLQEAAFHILNSLTSLLLNNSKNQNLMFLTLHVGQTNPLMFSITPRTGIPVLRQKVSSFRTSSIATA